MSRGPERAQYNPPNEFKKKKKPKTLEQMENSSTKKNNIRLTENDRRVTHTEYSKLINALYDPVGKLLFLIKEAGIPLNEKEQAVLEQHLSRMNGVVAQMRLVVASQQKHIIKQKQKDVLSTLRQSEIEEINTVLVELSEVETAIFEVEIIEALKDEIDNKFIKVQAELTEVETALNDLEEIFFPLFSTSDDPENSDRFTALSSVSTYYTQLEKFESKLQMMNLSSTNNTAGEPNIEVIKSLQSLLEPLEKRIATITDSTNRIEIFTRYNQLNKLLKLISDRVRNLSLPILSPQPQSSNSAFKPTEFDIFIKKLVSTMKKLGMSLSPLGFPGGIEGNATFPLEERVKTIMGREWSKDYIIIEVWTRKLNGGRGTLIKEIFIEGKPKTFTQSKDGGFFTEPRDLSPEDEKKFSEARKLFDQMVNDPRNQHLLFRMLDNVGVSKSASTRQIKKH